MRTIFEIAEEYGTDKRSRDHDYVRVYHTWFEIMRDYPIRLLEIGYGSGQSMRLWAEYFPRAELYTMELGGEEYSNQWKSPELKMDRVNFIIGDQSKKETWDKVPENLDIVIDDGSHMTEHQIASVNLGFSKLKLGGLWAIEDLQCGFHPVYNGGKSLGTDTFYAPWIFNLVLQQQIPYVTTNGNFYQNRYFMPEGLTRNIFSYHFYKSLVILEKTAVP